MVEQSKFRSGREERRRRLSERPSPAQRKAPRNSLPLRRTAAVLLPLVFLLLAVLLAVGSQETFEHDAQLTRSEPHLSAPLVEIQDCGRSCTDYVLSTDGGVLTLSSSHALYDAELGDEIEYVVDPEDPEWTVAVGELADWEPDPAGDLLLLIVSIGVALWMSAWFINKLVPEDLKRLFNRSPRPPSAESSWGA